MADVMDLQLQSLPLDSWHRARGGRMVPFAGYEMPVQYPMGVMQEHIWTRTKAGLFDVSHMGQVILRGADAAAKLETLVPVDVIALKEGRQRYAMFTNDDGGILDDLMVANRGDHLFVVVNAACKEADVAHMQAHMDGVEVVADRALLALQGPLAEKVLMAYADVSSMKFMDVAIIDSAFGPLWISRSGYSGEDGLEISVMNDQATAFARALLADADCAPIGLGARDSLRLEAGLCLYGSDIDTTTSPIEADLAWAIQKSRRSGARAGGFPGAARILDELENGAARKRVGILPEGRAPMRAHTPLYAAETGGDPIGEVTSGAFGPSIERPMSMGYIPAELAQDGATIWGEVRGKRLPAKVTALPFRPSTYKR